MLKHNILWHKSYWHSGKFKFVKKVFDFVWSIVISIILILKFKPAAIYSEAFPGAIMGHYLARLFGLPHMIHSFEPHTEYMVEAGVWTEKSWEAKLLRRYEKKIALRAKYIFTATAGMINRLKMLNTSAEIYRVPSCVDLSIFKFSEIHRIKVRNELEYQEEDQVIVYLGKFGGMYMEQEIFEFFQVCCRSSVNFKFLILTVEDHKLVANHIKEFNLDPNLFHIRTLQRKDIHKYLSAADFGFVPVRQNPGKRFCSPIKDGEYWACGLPILIFDGISDDYLLAEQYNIGIRITDTSSNSYLRAVENIEKWIEDKNKEEVRLNCQSFVRKDRNVVEYRKLYRQLFLKL